MLSVRFLKGFCWEVVRGVQNDVPLMYIKVTHSRNYFCYINIIYVHLLSAHIEFSGNQ